MAKYTFGAPPKTKKVLGKKKKKKGKKGFKQVMPGSSMAMMG